MPLPLVLLVALAASDTLRIPIVSPPPNFDGAASEAKYGQPTVEIPRAAGTIRIWLRRDSTYVYIAAAIPDRTFYWGDDFVISLDTWGDRARAPEHDDFQWYFRRVLDSSVVFRGGYGSWHPPREDPDWRLGPGREEEGWAVRSRSDSAGWSVELRLDPAYFTQARGGLPGIAFRVFDDGPQGWFAWPVVPAIRQQAEVERRPALWAAVIP